MEDVAQSAPEAIASVVNTASNVAGEFSASVSKAASSAIATIPMPRLLQVMSARVSNALCSGIMPVKLPHVDECEPHLGAAVLLIFLAPFIWNVVGRLEYYTRILCTIFVRPGIGTTVVAMWIFLFSLYRDAVFFEALQHQPRLESMDSPLYHVAAGAFAVIGMTLVLTSFWRLGFYGTYLGDYFGILMDNKVTGFPFDVTDHPMYDGSTLLFLSKAIMEKSPAGIALSVWVFIMYRVACVFEGPFTTMIYEARDRREKSSKSE